MKKVIDLTGNKYGKLAVLGRDFDKTCKNIHWFCICDCGNPKIISVTGNNLKNGNTSSCGCYAKEKQKQTKNFKTNKWYFENDIAVGFTTKNQKFYIDINDYEKVKNYCWRLDREGYVVSNKRQGKNKTIRIHRLIMDAKEDELIDHINWDRTLNIKSNLRIATLSENNVNIKRKSNNSSGYTGIKPTKNGKWQSQISFNNIRYYLGTFDDIQDAIEVRHNAEINLHKNFSGEINRQDYIKWLIKGGNNNGQCNK
jgi:hypothetical protein